MTKYPDICFVTRKWAPAVGGMETWSQQISAELAKHVPLEVIALPGRSNGLPPTALALLAFPFRVAWRYLRRKRAPDILHIGDMALWPVGLLARLRHSSTQIIMTAHGTDVSYTRRAGLRGRLYGAYLQLGARMLGNATVITNSRATERATHENGWSNTQVIPLATDIIGPAPDGSHNGSILFVGRLVELKGCAWFIRNVLPLLPEGFHLQVAGTCIDNDERAALTSPRVTYLGKLQGDLLVEAFSKAMCIVLPNIRPASGTFEGFGLVATEGAAAGGVVIAARCGGLPEAVVDQRTGFLIEPEQPELWANEIMRIAHWTEEERRSFIQKSMQCADAQFRWPRVAKDILQIYQRTAANLSNGQ